ncbi:unnamed protein product [Ambrosiozyma monospora]|uniref:Unnamed protein product n=1 Tax=Ambrosiozyma monospora TaxID=43982 RepID=A0ACB5T438_AMBMO|nr:unnamed protein product [Ambrosiozyma monospora]
MGLQGESKASLLATVLVVVVLTVILFGGTTAGMLEMLNIKTGCVEENESDDEFDIEMPPPQAQTQGGASAYRKGMYSHVKGKDSNGYRNSQGQGHTQGHGHGIQSHYTDETRESQSHSRSRSTSASASLHDADYSVDLDLDLPPSAPLANFPSTSAGVAAGSPSLGASNGTGNLIDSETGAAGNAGTGAGVNGGVFSNMLSMDEHARWFTNFDENVLKPVLLDNLSVGGHRQHARDDVDGDLHQGNDGK